MVSATRDRPGFPHIAGGVPHEQLGPKVFRPGTRVTWQISTPFSSRTFIGVVTDTSCAYPTFEVGWYENCGVGRFVEGAVPDGFRVSKPGDVALAKGTQHFLGKVAMLEELLAEFGWPGLQRQVLESKLRWMREH